MVQLLSAILSICVAIFVKDATSKSVPEISTRSAANVNSTEFVEDILPWSEYNLGILLEVIKNITFYTTDYYLKGGYSLEEVVSFHCSTPSRLHTVEVFKNDTEIELKLDVTKKLFMIVHGYTDHKDHRWINRMHRDVIRFTDSNVCSVNWFKLATLYYSLAVKHMKSVGNYVGDFLLSLDHLIPMERVSLLGHSLGSHVAGMIGERTGGRIDAIFALDPAHPGATLPMKPLSERLDPSDAKLVQVLHTTSGTVGTPHNIGTQDWYADDGKSPQKGCTPGDIVFDEEAIAPLSLMCSHLRGVDLFRYALDPKNKFKSSMGGDLYGYWTIRKPGVYNFPTVAKRPYVPQDNDP